MARIALLSLLLLLFTFSTQEYVKVSVYYESLCPDCIEFIKYQLFPAQLKLRRNLVLDLVPFGNAEETIVDGKRQFRCQHGIKECFGNKMQACVLRRMLTWSQKIRFVGCIMQSKDPSSESNGENCAKITQIPWMDVATCTKGTKGDWALEYFANRTKSLVPALTYVPHLLFNGTFNGTLEKGAITNFLDTVCSLYTTKPDVCPH